MKKLLSIMLVITMVLSVLPMTAFAATSSVDAWLAELEKLNNNGYSDTEKLEVILGVYEELKNSDKAEEYPELEVVGGLFEELVVPGENGEAILTPEQAVEIAQTAVNALVKDSEVNITEEAITEVTNKVTETVKELPVEKQLEVITKVTETTEKLDEIQQSGNGSSIIPDGVGDIIPGVGDGENEVISMASISKYLKIVQKVITNLRNENLWTEDADAKYAVVSSEIFDMLMNGKGKIGFVDLAKKLNDMLFNQEGHTVEQKARIIVVIYKTLEAEGAIDAAVNKVIGLIIEYYDDAYEYADKNGYVDAIVGYIEEAIAEVEVGKKAVADYAVEAELAAVKDALLAEFDTTVADLNKIKALLENDALATVDGAYVELVALYKGLNAHVTNICTLANEIGFVVNGYIDALSKVEIELEDLYEILEKLAKEFGVDIEDIEDKLGKTEEEIKDYIAHLFEGEYEISVDSFYLAIVEGESSYPDIVAKTLGLSADQYKKVTAEEVTAEDIARADFITVGYGEFTAVNFTADQILGVANNYVEYVNGFIKAVDGKIDAKYPALVEKFDIDIYTTVMDLVKAEAGAYLGMIEGKTVTELDWAELVGEENLSYVDEIRAEIVKAVVAAGVPETFTYSIDVVEMVGEFIAEATDNLATVNVEELAAALGEHAVFTLEVNAADLVVFAVESALYDFISYNVEYSDLVLNINAVNPEALVAVLGDYNLFDINYDIVIDEYTFTLADILALVDFDQIPVIAEFEDAVSDILAIEDYDVVIPVAKLVNLALGEYYDVVDYVVSIELPVSDETKALIDKLINKANTYVERFAGKVAKTEVYTVTLPLADLVKLVCEYGYQIDALINASLNAEITVGGVTVNATDALDVLANVTSIHPFAYAVAFRNVFYVDISDAREGGEEYIAEQILDALTVTYVYIRGDVNGDGVVNDVDALYLLRHTLAPEAYLINQNGDMNGDGIVNDTDAIYLLRHTMLPEEYPLY